MARRPKTADSLFLRAEQMAHDFSLFPEREDPAEHIQGLLSKKTIEERVKQLQSLEVDEYIRQTVQPSEDKSRLDSRKLLRRLKGNTLVQGDCGPLYWAEVVLDCEGQERRIGFLAQNRSEQNGVWMPEHHREAVRALRQFTQRSLPIVTFIDTPGANAGAEANASNQAHSISHLIAEMAQIDVPCVGIIMGAGYSGGAIPLATVNILLSVRDGVFNTIQPLGLASIARKYDLSWQECAKSVGVSAFELYEQGYIDGIIDYVPSERDKLINVRRAIFSSLEHIENQAKEFVRKNPYVFDHYRRSMQRYLNPVSDLQKLQEGSPLSQAEYPTTQLNIFGVAYRYLRYLSLRGKIRSVSRDSYSRLSDLEIPKGDLKKRANDDRRKAFLEWLEKPLELRYDERLLKAWKVFRLRKRAREEPQGRFRKLVFGSADEQFEQSRKRLCLEFSLHLYNQWKNDSGDNLLSLIDYLVDQPHEPPGIEDSGMTVKDVMLQTDIRQPFIEGCQDVLIFNATYDHIIQNLQSVAREASEYNIISEGSVRKLLDAALTSAAQTLSASGRFRDLEKAELERTLGEQFEAWILDFKSYSHHEDALKGIESWKQNAFPRISETLFAIVTFFFDELLPRYYDAQRQGKAYDGRIQPRNIGIKDFWNRLAIAYRDLLIQQLLRREKKQHPITPASIVDRFFTDFNEINGHLMTTDPTHFPGFRLSIEEALSQDITPCGLVTGIGLFKEGGTQMGIAISNLQFQAGAFDMASAEKYCDLLRECMVRQIPMISFISSGGMQTKEGAGSLFSMPIVNDRLTRFIRDQNLPVICFGFGDCTGGAQASFVTHPLVQTYYFSGTNMPFAGQIVVPSYLPSTATLSNYLSEIDGSMQGIVKHPFWENMDADLEGIDPRIPVPRETVEDVVTRILEGRFSTTDDKDKTASADVEETQPRPVRKVLIHARGCSAAKLVKKAQEHNIEVVLLQSDADSDSAVSDMLSDTDTLVCIGGNTPDESYLNATSVIRVAEQEKVDAIHPGIGFLSESAHFADLCRSHGIIFIGPSVSSMQQMGNKSNAIATANKLGVPVVPGSNGIVTTAQTAKRIAGHITYPVLIKAVHGGGGKGIQVVETADDLAEAFRRVRAEARSAFGSSDVYLEKFIRSMRHVEVQLLRDFHGNTVVLGIRDCTVQRNNQKLVEESASTMLPEFLLKAVCDHAAAITTEINYTGAGTVEFIYDIPDNTIYFMEMNTRLQVEHPVTEAITGVDIVKAQFDIASGKSIANLQYNPRGHAIEVRLNAEVVSRDDNDQVVIQPSPGTVSDCYFPSSDDSWVITGIGPEKTISPFYDSMIAQIICWGEDRNAAIKRMVQLLDDVQIKGVPTNLSLLRAILTDQKFIDGQYDTGYLPELLSRLDLSSKTGGGSAVEDGLTLTTQDIAIEGTTELKVVAPSSGVFYVTASPNDPELVSVGDVIDTKEQICLLEAMKLFTPITLDAFNRNSTELYPRDKQYRVVRIVPTNGQVVNAKDLLFVVEPADA
jgi:acetyl/propionyl-CoA carboxylase alpha subunit